MADTRCDALGAWTQRPIVLRDAIDTAPWLLAEPGDWGAVEIGAPHHANRVRQSRWALGALAYVLFDGIARATVNGKAWARIERPRGRQHEARRVQSNAERQAGFRARRKGGQTVDSRGSLRVNSARLANGGEVIDAELHVSAADGRFTS